MKEQSRLKQLREGKNLTQKQLAKALNLKRQSVSNWEIDFSTAHLKVAIRLADFFNVSIDYLIGRNFIQTKKELLVELIKSIDVDKLVELILEAQKKD